MKQAEKSINYTISVSSYFHNSKSFELPLPVHLTPEVQGLQMKVRMNLLKFYGTLYSLYS